MDHRGATTTNMVLRSDVVLWPQQSPMDITNEVIRKVNDMKAPTPAPAGGAPTGGEQESWPTACSAA